MTHLANLIHQEGMLQAEIARLQTQIEQLQAELAQKRTGIQGRIKAGEEIPDRLEMIVRQTCGGGNPTNVYDALKQMNEALLPFVGQFIVFVGNSRVSIPSNWYGRFPRVSEEGVWISVLGQPENGIIFDAAEENYPPRIRCGRHTAFFSRNSVEVEEINPELFGRMIIGPSRQVVDFPWKIGSTCLFNNGHDYITVLIGNEVVFDWWTPFFGTHPHCLLYRKVCALLGVVDPPSFPQFDAAYASWKSDVIVEIDGVFRTKPGAQAMEIYKTTISRARAMGFDPQFIFEKLATLGIEIKE